MLTFFCFIFESKFTLRKKLKVNKLWNKQKYYSKLINKNFDSVKYIFLNQFLLLFLVPSSSAYWLQNYGKQYKKICAKIHVTLISCVLLSIKKTNDHKWQNCKFDDSRDKWIWKELSSCSFWTSALQNQNGFIVRIVFP